MWNGVLHIILGFCEWTGVRWKIPNFRCLFFDYHLMMILGDNFFWYARRILEVALFGCGVDDMCEYAAYLFLRFILTFTLI